MIVALIECYNIGGLALSCTGFQLARQACQTAIKAINNHQVKSTRVYCRSLTLLAKQRTWWLIWCLRKCSTQLVAIHHQGLGIVFCRSWIFHMNFDSQIFSWFLILLHELWFKQQNYSPIRFVCITSTYFFLDFHVALPKGPDQHRGAKMTKLPSLVRHGSPGLAMANIWRTKSIKIQTYFSLNQTNFLLIQTNYLKLQTCMQPACIPMTLRIEEGIRVTEPRSSATQVISEDSDLYRPFK